MYARLKKQAWLQHIVCSIHTHTCKSKFTAAMCGKDLLSSTQLGSLIQETELEMKKWLELLASAEFKEKH